MEILRSWIVNIITIMIVSFFVEILMPSGDFKKYSKLVLGLIVMIMIIKPIVQLSDGEVLLNRMTIETGNYIDKTKIIEQSKMLKDTQTQQIVNTYKNKISEQITQRVKSVNGNYGAETKVDIDTNIDSSGFGSIRNIEILLLRKNESKYVSSIDPIEPIKVSSNMDKEIEEFTKRGQKSIREIEELDSEEKKLKSMITDYIESTYMIPKANIYIQIQKNI